VQAQLPGGVSGIRIPNQNIPDGTGEIKLEVEAQATATPGHHQLTLRLQMNFNGQNLILEQPFAVSVTEATDAAGNE
ncbi:MAG: hypothetical protein KDA85_03935, partial [Planctomycetaceae bacterium]|nr:hypothetical protein [Planctomycetaceae bacterium]